MRSFAEAWREIAERPDGPFAFRFYCQPLMAMLLAIRDGTRDARAGRRAYLWSLVTDPRDRWRRVREGWRSVGKVFLLAIALDVVYQLVVLRDLHPLASLLVAVALAIVPYLLLRGPVNRVLQIRGRRRATAP